MSVPVSYDMALDAYRQGDHALCQTLTGQLLASGDEGGALVLRAVTMADDRPAEAAACYHAACRAAPFSVDSWFNLGVWLHGQRCFHDAADAYRRALALDPGHEGALLNGTEALRITEHFEECLPHARRLQALLPDHPAGYTHEAIALQHLGQLEAADPVFAAALARTPNKALLHWEQHFSYLARGRFAQAWECYEDRFACSGANSVDDMATDLPRWDGTADRHVLLYGEQGLGDQLMFASALTDLAGMSSKVSLAVAPALVSLFEASFPQVAVYPLMGRLDPVACADLVARAGALQPVDAVLPLGSLMVHFRRRAEDFSGKPYLISSQAARTFWEDREADRKRAPFRLGLCWACGPAGGRFAGERRAVHRTMALSSLAPLMALPGIETVAITNQSLGEACAFPIADVSDALTDLDRTAALLERIDLLITVDTSVAHLAGALGVPVWILLHHAGDPRWGLPGTERSYWYDSARLFWQSEPGNWSELVARVEQALAKTMRQSERRRSA